jgi:uncharacterized protein YqfA (UPF0365 family)
MQGHRVADGDDVVGAADITLGADVDRVFGHGAHIIWVVARVGHAYGEGTLGAGY